MRLGRHNFECFDILAEKDGQLYIIAVTFRNHSRETGDAKDDAYFLYRNSKLIALARRLAAQYNAIPGFVVGTVSAPMQTHSAWFGLHSQLKSWTDGGREVVSIPMHKPAEVARYAVRATGALLLDPLQLPALSPHTGSLNLVHVDANLPDIWIGTRGLGLGGFRLALSLIGFQHVRCCTRLHPSHCTRRQCQAGNDDG